MAEQPKFDDYTLCQLSDDVAAPKCGQVAMDTIKISFPSDGEHAYRYPAMELEVPICIDHAELLSHTSNPLFQTAYSPLSETSVRHLHLLVRSN